MTQSANRGKRIGLTMGDPSGIGPEILVTSLRDVMQGAVGRLVVFGDAHLAAQLPEGVRLVEVSQLEPSERSPGAPTSAGAHAQVAYLEAAVAAARSGEISALVTAPISKAQVQRAGFAFPGHTEFLAARLRAERCAMMFAGPRLKVVLATIHTPLRDVSERLTHTAILNAIELGAASLRDDFGIARPRVGVAGLNPHAGEGGLFGREELEAMAPAITAARASGVDVSDPIPADAIFREAVEGRFDLVVAMYHDQGLIPVKLIDFESAVNVTLGLPIIRTSPDHGVAYDIAGTGRARATSFSAALSMADRMLVQKLGTASSPC